MTQCPVIGWDKITPIGQLGCTDGSAKQCKLYVKILKDNVYIISRRKPIFGGDIVPAEDDDGEREAIPDDPPLLIWPLLFHEEST